MTFPVYSTSVETAPVKRIVTVLQRSNIAPMVSHAGVFNCRRVSGSSTWSQHAWGNGVDLFPRQTLDDHDACRRIADHAVLQARTRTLANRGLKLPIYDVIDHQNSRRWTRTAGWSGYSGTVGPHVHITGYPYKTGTPPCA